MENIQNKLNKLLNSIVDREIEGIIGYDDLLIKILETAILWQKIDPDYIKNIIKSIESGDHWLCDDRINFSAFYKHNKYTISRIITSKTKMNNCEILQKILNDKNNKINNTHTDRLLDAIAIEMAKWAYRLAAIEVAALLENLE